MSPFRILVVLLLVAVAVAGCGGSIQDPAPSASRSAPSSTPAAIASTIPSCPPPTTIPRDDPWWTDRVFYEVFVRSFADSDGDGIGDLAGLTARLDALNDGDPSTHDDLGITALWLMPVATSPSYHGYDVADYRVIDPDYGTNDDFKTLVAAARERGIEIIVDLVMNHTSVEHPWFVDARTPGSEHDDWYVWSDEHPGFGGPGGRPVWHADGDRWYYGYFWEGMPDLNLAEPAVTAEMDDIARFWVDEMGVAGFRLDAARHLIEDGSRLENTPATTDWLRGFRGRLKADAPDALVLGEVWDATSVASRYVTDGALDLTFDFGLAGQFLAAVRNADAGSTRIVQSEVTEAYPAGGYAAFLTNHDQDRTMDMVGGDISRAKQAATLLLTNPGIPFIYYGEEVGLRGRKPDERIRTPLPWTGDGPGFGFTTAEPWQPMAADVERSNVAVQTGDPDSILSHYRELIRLRSDQPALRPGGELVPIEASDRAVYAVLRHDPAGAPLVIISNLSDDPVADVALSLPAGPLCGSPQPDVLLGSPIASPSPLLVTAAGGFDGWRIGSMEPHQDLVIALAP